MCVLIRGANDEFSLSEHFFKGALCAQPPELTTLKLAL